MRELTIEAFDVFFDELHGHRPYPWQQRLAERAVAGEWPGAIDLPTGSGKTAAIDIAVFALACQAALPPAQRTAPRRLFFCVNRRVIVDEAYGRARGIAENIWRAEQDGERKPVLKAVASALRRIAGPPIQATATDPAPPLDVLEIRGGIYRDNRWARSITQPTVVCTTLDQLGSRLLFRGYGVSTGAAPIQAALVAYDSLILLDEAHISEPFRQSLENVQRYVDPQRWAEQSIGARPLTVVPMTATPNGAMRAAGVVRLEESDRQEKRLADRLTAPKPAQLSEVKNIVDAAVKAAEGYAADGSIAIGVIVNRVTTARKIHDRLRELQSESNAKKRKIPADAPVELVIGSMRPVDRDRQADRFSKIVGPERPKPISTHTSFVVATQCLEVGADYDFDVLITECASLDAVRQRFGRLNRAGRAIGAQALLLIDKKDVKSEDAIAKVEASNDPRKRQLDPIYGNAQARTWNWLHQHADDGVIDFGIDAFDRLLEEHGKDGKPPVELLAPAASLNAPVMMPAYVDFWSQTAPQPAPDPDVSLFVHGPQGGEPDVQVCWRADLIEDDHLTRDDWCDIVALLPPTAAECVRVPIGSLRRWLRGDTSPAALDHGDALGTPAEAEDRPRTRMVPAERWGVAWRGPADSEILREANHLRPGDTLVLPTTADAAELAHLPESALSQQDEANRPSGAITDVAETAFASARDKAALRLHPALKPVLPGAVFEELVEIAGGEEPVPREHWRDLLRQAAMALPNTPEGRGRRHCIEQLATQPFVAERYPDQRGVVLISRKPMGTHTDWFLPPMDDGDDEASRLGEGRRVILADHLRHVSETLQRNLQALPLADFDQPLRLAAEYHDLGKADERFQAMLRRSDRTDAWLRAGVAATDLAKSDSLPPGQDARRAARQRAGLPDGFRHEMLSVQVVERFADALRLPEDTAERDLILHLIAAHHGRGRPFAPVVVDEELPPVEIETSAADLSLSHEARAKMIPPHRLDSGIPERFWRLTRRFGWWGLAYLEATLRLADQQASTAEEADPIGQVPTASTTGATP